MMSSINIVTKTSTKTVNTTITTNNNNHTQSSLVDYPIDIILSILVLLPTSELVKLKLVCRTICHLINSSPCLWRFIHIVFTKYWDKWQLVHQLLLRHVTMIRSLTLTNIRDDVIDSHISIFTQLETLELTGWITLSDYAFRSLTNTNTPSYPLFPRLKKFTLSQYTSTYCAVSSMTLSKFIQNAPNLIELHIWCNIQLTPEFTRQLSYWCPQLRILSLSSMQWHNNNQFIHSFNSFTNLNYLALSHVHHLNNDGLIKLTPYLAPNLHTILLHGSSYISDNGIRTLASQSLYLNTIKLFDCPNVSLGIMDDLGFDSMLVAKDIRLRPCFKFGMGMGFVRTHSISPSVILVPNQFDQDITTSSSTVESFDSNISNQENTNLTSVQVNA